jgi:hypothetical protein
MIYALGAALGALWAGSKLFGSDPDFTQAYCINQATGQGGFFKTLFADGLRSMFFGSRTNSALLGSGMLGRYPLGCSIYGGPMAYNPYIMNPMIMGQLPYSPMAFGRGFWPHF